MRLGKYSRKFSCGIGIRLCTYIKWKPLHARAIHFDTSPRLHWVRSRK